MRGDDRADLIEALIAELGLAVPRPALETWCRATAALASDDRAGDARIEALAGAWASARGAPPRHLGREAIAHLSALEAGDREVALGAQEIALDALARLTDADLRDRLLDDTLSLRAALETLRDDPPTPLGARVRALLPEIGALAVAAEPHAAFEHEPSAAGAPPRPLLEHLADRTLGRKLLGLERADRRRFQRDDALSAPAFAEECAALAALARRGLLSAVRAALLHLDFAKGGTPAARAVWSERLGADLSIHNAAARRILERATAPGLDRPGVLLAFSALRERPPIRELVLALVESHGLTGQIVRGETTLASLAPFVAHARIYGAALAGALGLTRDAAIRAAFDALHAVNLCDTAAVREGLYGDALRSELLAIEREVLDVALGSDTHDARAIERELSRGAPPSTAAPPSLDPARRVLADRLARLRRSRTLAGEPASEPARVAGALSEPVALRLARLFATCQLWYAEAATASLSAEAQLKVLALALVAAEASSVDVSRPFHVTLLDLVRHLNARADGAVAYRVRLLETALRAIDFDEITGRGARALALLGADSTALPLVGLSTEIGRAKAIAIGFSESEEASALLKLLAIYERKSSAAFHATLKALCDLYGLRKDEFDRLANESTYLVHMNSARTDKERMLEFVRPGRVAEIGPGGGVVLDLLADRFPTSEIIGIDRSRMVVEALLERKKKEGRRWRLVEADAFAIEEHLGRESIDTIVFCSVLHEIYSYVEYPSDDGGVRGRFRLEAVRDLLRASYRALVPGGRLVIRDGVMPPPATRVLEFLEPEAEQYFILFASEFQGRRVAYEAVGPSRVRLSSADAMEFLYKYTWGAASFPYEIREQYGVLPYAEYRDRILAWLAREDRPPRAVPLPRDLESYLQRGYVDGLGGRVALYDEHGAPVPLPDSNAMIVVEKSA